MVNVTATSVVLIGLRPESTFTISVRAYTAAGPGEERRLTSSSYYQHQLDNLVRQREDRKVGEW